jgi:uncharacterized protein (TIGR03032 family)
MSNVEPLRSVHTANLPAMLRQIGASLVASTYQAGRVIFLRYDNGLLNTHFRCFDKPMGLAIAQNRLAVGTAMEIWEFHNIPAVCDRLNQSPSQDAPSALAPSAFSDKLTGAQHCDACFLPRIAHCTGDIQIHEMVWVGEDLIFVNTLFSCLARRSQTFNFEPVWRPAFVKQLIPGDCCHLNGLAVRDGAVRYVTALGESDQPSGWRTNKKNGGLLIDVASNEIIAKGLSMPHSPRWYDDRLWCLQSGTGGFGLIDLQTGKYESVVELPGFTRGLAFYGPLAFIGLSQVRENAFFGGVPIAQKTLGERSCGVWVVNIASGEVLAMVKFEDAVQEIFAVEVLSGAIYPELVNDDRKLLAETFELHDDVLRDVPEELRR